MSSNGSGQDSIVDVSDNVILSIGVAGLCVMVVSVYKLIYLRAISGEEIADIADDAKLIQADVHTLTRAQRRARAKAIMKQNRLQQQQDNIGADGQQQLLQPIPAADPNDNQHNIENINQQLQKQQGLKSRKERIHLAKEIERKERQLSSSERVLLQQKQYDREQIQKQQRRKQKELDIDTRKILELQKQQREEYNYVTFLSPQVSQLSSSTASAMSLFQTSASSTSADLIATQPLLVEDLIRHLDDSLQQQSNSSISSSVPTSATDGTVVNYIDSGVVILDQIASCYNVSVQHVIERIQTLVTEKRIAGFFHTNRFVYISELELQTLATRIVNNRQSSSTKVQQLETTSTRPNDDTGTIHLRNVAQITKSIIQQK